MDDEAWLPYLPIPARFAASTLLYAGILWAPVATVGAVRRAARPVHRLWVRPCRHSGRRRLPRVRAPLRRDR